MKSSSSIKKSSLSIGEKVLPLYPPIFLVFSINLIFSRVFPRKPIHSCCIQFLSQKCSIPSDYTSINDKKKLLRHEFKRHPLNNERRFSIEREKMSLLSDISINSHFEKMFHILFNLSIVKFLIVVEKYQQSKVRDKTNLILVDFLLSFPERFDNFQISYFQ